MAKEENNLFDDVSFGEMIEFDSGFAPIKQTEKEQEEVKDEEKPTVSLEKEFEEIEISEEDIIKGNEIEEDKEDIEKNPSQREQVSSSPFNLFAQALFDEGIISEFDPETFEGNSEELMELIRKEVASNIEEYKNSLPEEAKDFVESIEKGIPIKEYKAVKSKKLEYKNLTEDVVSAENAEDLRKQILYDFYKRTTAFDDAKINKFIQKSIDLGEDVEEAVSAVEDLKKFYEEDEKNIKLNQQKQEEQAKLSYENYIKTIREKLEAVDEIIPGQKLTKKQKDTIYNMQTKIVGQDENGRAVNAVGAKRAEDPIKFDNILAGLIEAGLFDGKAEKVTKRAKSSAIKQLEETIQGYQFNNKSKTSTNTSSIEADKELFSTKRR